MSTGNGRVLIRLRSNNFASCDCPYCGGTWSETDSFVKPPRTYKQYGCANCREQIFVYFENGRAGPVVKDDYEKEHFFSKTIQAIFSGLNACNRLPGEHRAAWKKRKRKIRKECIKRKEELDTYAADTGRTNDAVVMMCQLACDTNNFSCVDYVKARPCKKTVALAQKIAKNLPDDSEEYLEFKRLKEAYGEIKGQFKRKAKRRNLVVALIMTVMLGVCGWFYVQPQTVYDPSVNIDAYIPYDAFLPWEKYALDLSAQAYDSGTAPYAATEQILQEAVGTFALYDISLTCFSKVKQPNAPVSVTVPIPQTLRDTDLVVYRVSNTDGTYAECPSKVSREQHTITFETDHFSLFAIGERAYRVKFEANGAIVADVKAVFGDRVAPPADPERYGYTFDTWRTGDREWDFASDTVNGSVTLQAAWIPNNNRLLFCAAGGEGEMDALVVPTDQSIRLPDCAFTKPDYAFVGWSCSLGGEAEYRAGDTFVMPADAETSLYAVWRWTFAVVTFDTTGGQSDVNSLILRQEEPYGALPVPTRTGYDFVSWSASENGEAIEETTRVPVQEEITLYAVWRERSYRITYHMTDPDEPQSAPARIQNPNAYQFLYSQYPDLQPATRSAYDICIGWYLDAACTRPLDEAWYRSWKEAPADIDVYPKWDIAIYYDHTDEIPRWIKPMGDRKRVCIDLSNGPGGTYTVLSHYNGTSYNKFDLVEDVTDLYMVGHADTEYLLHYICVSEYSQDQEVTIHLRDFQMVGGICTYYEHAPGTYAEHLIIDTAGRSGIVQSGDQKSTIDGFRNVTITGDGSLRICGNMGAEGTDGGIAVKADRVVMDMTGTLRIQGGNGGSGADAEDQLFFGASGRPGEDVAPNRHGKDAESGQPGGQGPTGYTGGNGGNGACAVVADQLIITERCLSVTLIGGNGAVGGAGGKGGTGGSGGDGGADNCGKPCCWGGNLPGDGGDGGNGGTGGTGGNGGRGAYAVSSTCHVQNDSHALRTTDGSAGNGGSGGMGGNPGSGGSGGSSGTNGGGGTAGDPGKPGEPGQPGATPTDRVG